MFRERTGKDLSGNTIAKEQIVQTPISLLFAGDAMFDRHIRLYSQKQGYGFFLSHLQDLFASVDHVIINLEGPVTNNTSVSLGSAVGSTKNFIFTFDPQILPFLKQWNMSIVNLGNNHIMNFGEDGLKQTYANLENNQIRSFGDTGSSLPNEKRFAVINIHDKNIAFVNFNQFVSHAEEHVFEDMEKAKKEADVIIVYAHWGAEYVSQADTAIQQLAHRFIDAGADVVIGSHPHVTQQKEEYRGKIIYYSLGNFVFDQYFSKETMQGLLVKVTIAPSKELSFEEIPIKMETNGQTVPEVK